MGSEERYYRRRLQEETHAARRAITAEALQRREALVHTYRTKLAAIEAARDGTTCREAAA